METARSRSESPLTRSKVKDLENGSEIGKGKKVIKNKQKSQQNDLESEDSRTSEKDDIEETGNEAENGVNDSENKITNGNGIENGHQDYEEAANNNGSINNCESQDATNGDYSQTNDNEAAEETMVATTSNDISDVTEDEEPVVSETEVCAKNDTPQDEFPQNGETVLGDAEDVSNGETDKITQQEEDPEFGSTIKSSPEQVHSNGSESGSHYEDAHSTKDDVQLSPDGSSLSSKLSSFWGKWNSPTQEEKRNLDVVPPKTAGGAVITHPYLSKVSGRRGIKERLNSSATASVLTDDGRRTPETFEINLDDSFRVRTNPPRLNSSGILENPTLKKYKGKRCLNASDEPEEDDDVDILNSTKRRKLNKSGESGLLGGLLWSPFKKKSVEQENDLKLSATESRITRFLSPFWFWKKLAAGEK